MLSLFMGLFFIFCASKFFLWTWMGEERRFVVCLSLRVSSLHGLENTTPSLFSPSKLKVRTRTIAQKGLHTKRLKRNTTQYPGPPRGPVPILLAHTHRPACAPSTSRRARGLARAAAVLLREAAQLALDALAEQLVAGIRVPAVAPASKVALLGEGAARLGRASHGGEQRVVHETERVGGRRLRVRLDARPDGDGGVDGGEVGGDGVVPVPTEKVPGRFREGSR